MQESWKRDFGAIVLFDLMKMAMLLFCEGYSSELDYISGMEHL
jgi:hypothetical protein